MAFMRPVTPSLSKQFDEDDADADDANDADDDNDAVNVTDDDDDDDECHSASLPIGAVRVNPLVQALPHYQFVAVKASGEEQSIPVFN